MDPLVELVHENVLRAIHRVGFLTPRAAVYESEHWLLIDAGVDLQDFNFALPRTRPADPVTALAEAAAWYRQRGQPFRLELREHADAAVVHAAAALGLLSQDSEPSMLLAPLPRFEPGPAELVIRRVEDETGLARYAEVDERRWNEVTRGIAATAAHFPDFHLMLGELNGEAIGTAMAVLTGTMVGVYNVHVRPEHRRQGYGRALTLAAIEAGRERGATAASLQASPMGEHLYASLGFRTIDRYFSFPAS